MNGRLLTLRMRVASLIMLLACTVISRAADRPNILLVMTDDQGYWDTGATGNPHIDTPNMNRLAREGARLSRYYAAPVCAPTRAGMMTGRYYLRTGLYNTRFGGDSMGLKEVTVAQLLSKAGYRTGMFGKWHLGKYPGYQPQQRGFDEFMGHYHGHIERYEFPDQLHHNGRPVEARGYVSDLFTNASIDFIEQTVKDDRPFFCALMYNAPHSPWLLDTSHFGQPQGDKLLQKYLSRKLPLREARIYALIERVDQNLGRLLDKLSELKILDETLVVFTSDNGGVSKFWKGGMNGQKASPYEGGVRAPCFVRWPKGSVPSGFETTAQTSHVDWLPTFCAAAGVAIPADRTIDGKNLLPLVRGSVDSHHRYVYHTWDRYTPNPDRRWSISESRWKLIGLFGANATVSPAKWRLFDLSEDPGEKRNVAKQHPETVKRLRAEFVRWFEEVTDGVEYKPVPIPVGNPAEARTEISPSWAKWEGPNVQYKFDGYDWDTIEGWRTPGESAVWRLNVQSTGDYRIQLRYGCRPLDAGGVLRIQLGKAQLGHQIVATTTADQFQDHELGVIHLERGATELRAEVLTAPGRELMRLNRIVLERIR